MLNVYVAPIDKPKEAVAVTSDKGRGIWEYFWSYTNSHIVYLQDKDGDENSRIYAVDIASKETRELTPADKVKAQIQAVSHKFPEEILIGLNDRNPAFHDVYHLNILTGEKKLILQNDAFGGFIIDDDYRIRLALKMTSDGGYDLQKPAPADKWSSFIKVSMDDSMNSEIVGFNKAGDTLYMLSSKGRNTAALISVNMETGAETLIAESEKADITSVMQHPLEKTVEGYRTEYLRNEWTFLDKAVEEQFTQLKKVSPGNLWITSRSHDDKRWVVIYEPDDGPVLFYIYDREAKKTQFLFPHRQALADQPLTHTYAVEIPSRDGLKLVSYYSLPVWADKEGKPDKPLPMVLYVHGGPWHRDSWGYNTVHQWLSNRGYAVLSVNFRGSTGLGKDFINKSTLEWGGKMHDDLIDAVNWAVQGKIADPEKIAIFGGSYGGYATLVGVTFTPKVFACGVDIVGPSNLVSFLNSIPAYWKPYLEMFTRRVGDHRTEEGRKFLMSRSPITYVDQIEKPLLIGQGANDPRVVKAESDQIVASMQKKGIPVTYLLYPDEGHGFMRPENRLSFFAVSEIFLNQCLGGRHEEIGDGLKGSSMQVLEGASIIPGLEEALPKVEEAK